MTDAAMQLLVMVVHDEDAPTIIDALIGAGLPGATRVPSLGGFLQQRSSTLLIALERAQVSAALQAAAPHCHTRAQYVDPLPPRLGHIDAALPYPLEVQVGGAVVFVLDLERYERW